MKKILVVSDNFPLVVFMKELEQREDIRKLANFVYCYSAVNKNSKDLQGVGMFPVDIKNKDVCRNIVDNYDLVISLHCKQIFPDFLVKNVTCINVHPGLNPYNRGWYPQVFSIINKKPAGATIHLMDEFIDAGPIIAQREVVINYSDTSKDVYDRVIDVEKKLIWENIYSIIKGSYGSIFPADSGNYNSIDDFKKLCDLDLGRKGTLGEHIDLLRALTHGNFKNAYFKINEDKYFVRIEIEKK